VAWALPNDRNVVLGRQRVDLLATLVFACDLIVIHKERTILKLGTPLVSTCDFLHCLFDASERISRARVKVHYLDVKRQLFLPNDVVQKLSVSLFGFAFTSEKDGFADGNMCVAPLHPICGTAPYAPPRYFL